jgi:steroid delta-isomerase-like uncharacterized protein
MKTVERWFTCFRHKLCKSSVDGSTTLTTSLQNRLTRSEIMSPEENKRIVRRIMSALNERDLDEVVSYYQSDAVFHGWAPEPVDVAGYQAIMSGILEAFPDSLFPSHDIIAGGDKVVVRHSLYGTHEAAFQGIPATFKPVVVNAMVIFRMENGKAAELWLNADFLGLMQQLGVIPVPEFA